MQGQQQIPTQWGDEKKTDNLGENGESFLSTFVRVNLSNLGFVLFFHERASNFLANSKRIIEIDEYRREQQPY